MHCGFLFKALATVGCVNPPIVSAVWFMWKLASSETKTKKFMFICIYKTQMYKSKCSVLPVSWIP